jgi:hypothetical protein
MRIHFERTGGLFPGLNKTRTISSQELPADQGKKMEYLVDSAKFFDLPAKMQSPEPGADRFQYKISVESETGTHTVQVQDGAVPPQLAPLLAWLKSGTE